MRVSDIGEFGLIELLSREFSIPYPPSASVRPRPGIIVDLGDDALVLAASPVATIWTTDTLVEGVHFLPGVTPWRNLGWKAIAVNVSDIAAMGGAPDVALVTLCLPAAFCVENALALYRGMKECCETYGIRLGGGDIVRSPFFSVTVALSGAATTLDDGSVAVLTRSAAAPGDVVALTGAVGASAAGLRLLQQGAERDEPLNRALIEAHERPRPRVDAGRAAVRAGVRCGMDVSDGVLQDLGHIARASRVAVRVDEAAVPVRPELRARFPDEALEFALTGGEDYELILCAPRAALERLVLDGLDLSLIGAVEAGPSGGEGRVIVVEASGRERAYEGGGWDHFRGGAF